ncbi:TIGR02452 family protein [Thioalkalivibrio sp.]|uniref:TIGR02452 family protein n=1 Tax=Thioalkalivibrio sp. TaxID=2093813 RepID=UPI0039747467
MNDELPHTCVAVSEAAGEDMTDPRSQRARIATETLHIIQHGAYINDQGRTVTLQPQLERCLKDTRLYRPENFAVLPSPLPGSARCTIEVRIETTLAGARRLAGREDTGRVGVLNFASAKNPGGGFLQGSQAQEESLARSSALYASLQRCPDYYTFHRHTSRTLLYSDHIIYSPGCPVFRDDEGRLLSESYQVDFITAPAPNRKALTRNEPERLPEIGSVLTRRCGRILQAAAAQGSDTLVLGAWGCGVFGNDPAEVAEAFAEHLLSQRQFRDVFRHICFSIPEHRSGIGNAAAFKRHFDRERVAPGSHQGRVDRTSALRQV